MKKMNETTQGQSQVLNSSFQDLDTLMDAAKHLFLLAEQMTKIPESSMNEFEKELMDVGYIQPVTKENSGSDYYEELSKQISDFLDKLSLKGGNRFSLVDVYCRFNRARGQGNDCIKNHRKRFH